MILASLSGTPVPAIGRLVAADEDTARDVTHAFNQRGLAVLDPHWAGGAPAASVTTTSRSSWPPPPPTGSATSTAATTWPTCAKETRPNLYERPRQKRLFSYRCTRTGVHSTWLPQINIGDEARGTHGAAPRRDTAAEARPSTADLGRALDEAGVAGRYTAPGPHSENLMST